MVTLVNGSEYDSNLDLLTWSPALSPAYHRLLFLMLHLWTQGQCRCCVRTLHMARCLQQGISASSSGHEHESHLELLRGAALRPALLTTSTLWHFRGDFLLPANYHSHLSGRGKAPLTFYFKIEKKNKPWRSLRVICCSFSTSGGPGQTPNKYWQKGCQWGVSEVLPGGGDLRPVAAHWVRCKQHRSVPGEGGERREMEDGSQSN